jgi:hypothetical protein
MEGTNINPFLYRRTFSRGRCHIISAYVFMLCLPNHAHQQEQPKYQKPQSGFFEYNLGPVRDESPYLGCRAA